MSSFCSRSLLHVQYTQFLQVLRQVEYCFISGQWQTLLRLIWGCPDCHDKIIAVLQSCTEKMHTFPLVRTIQYLRYGQVGGGNPRSSVHAQEILCRLGFTKRRLQKINQFRSDITAVPTQKMYRHGWYERKEFSYTLQYLPTFCLHSL